MPTRTRNAAPITIEEVEKYIEEIKKEPGKTKKNFKQDSGYGDTPLEAGGYKYLLDEINELQKGIGLLGKEKQTLTTERDNALQEIARLKNHTCSTSGIDDYFIKNLRQQLDQARREKNQAEENLQTEREVQAQARQEINSKVEEIEANKNQIVGLTNEKNEFQEQLKKLTAKNTDLETDLAAETRAKGEVKSNLTNTQKELENRTKEVNNSQEQINTLNNQLKNTLQSLYDLQNENKELVKRPLLVDYQKLQVSLAEAQDYLTAEREKAAEALKSYKEQAEQINTKLTAENAELTENLTKYRTELEEKVVENETLTANLEEAE
ncbi:9733_t:CDS:2, partial [Ambispora gerdemannii]